MVRVSRVTKAPGRAAAGTKAAARLLTEIEVREGLRLDSDDLAVLKACCSHRPPRNAAAIVRAIQVRLEYSQTKPKQEIGLSGTVTLEQLVPKRKDTP